MRHGAEQIQRKKIRGGLIFKMVKSRKPMHVDSSFEKKVKEIQKQIRKAKGEEMSLREITAQITKDPDFERIEAKLIGCENGINLNIKLDRRLLE